VATTQKRSIWRRIDIGVPLIGSTIAIAVGALGLAARATDDTGARILILVLSTVLIAVLWFVAARNAGAERAVRRRLQEQHPGALVERVRIWALPHGRLEPGTPQHFIVADASEISFETVEQTVLLRIPVAELGLADLVTAQGDRSRDKALTLIYGEFQDTVQVFTLTFTGVDKLRARVRKAIGWPPEGTPTS
jgi:hypothetical protein